jgi:glycosyl transferase family 25
MWYDYIDKIVYINLDRRVDRNANILKEMKRLQIPINKFQRFSAIENARGAIGCTFSHVKVLQMAIEQKWKNVLILEDDFIFIDSGDTVNTNVNYFFEKVVPVVKDWSVINFSRGAGQRMRPVDTTTFVAYGETNNETVDAGDKIVWKADAISSTSGYLVNQPFFETLLNNYKEGLVGLMKTYDKPKYALDMYWMPLQSASPGWFIFNPSLGYQYESYSDVEQQVVDYVSYDKSIKFDKKGMLNIRLKGGLGNQMFQIAAGCGIAWFNDMDPVFEKIYESPSVFEPRPVYWDSLLRNVPVKKTHELSKHLFAPLTYPSNEYVPMRLAHNKNYSVDGYFQNPRFFEMFRDRITTMFQLPDTQMSAIQKVFESLVPQDKKAVMVHVRHGDYMKLQKFHVVQTMDYYNTARDRIEESVKLYSELLKYTKDDLVYVIFSDDIDWCRSEFGQWSQSCIYVDKDVHAKLRGCAELKNVQIDVCEMMMMSLATHAIIANSSFSWWGAYLIKNTHKLIMAPSKWLVDEAKNIDALHIVDKNMFVV